MTEMIGMKKRLSTGSIVIAALWSVLAVLWFLRAAGHSGRPILQNSGFFCGLIFLAGAAARIALDWRKTRSVNEHRDFIDGGNDHE